MEGSELDSTSRGPGSFPPGKHRAIHALIIPIAQMKTCSPLTETLQCIADVQSN